MLISCALFAGATHAWFSDRCSAQITLQSATFDVKVEVTTPEGGTSEISTENGVYVCNLSTGTYTVTLTRIGEGTVGYCAITVGGNQYRSDKLPAQPDNFSFKLEITSEGEQPVSVTFTPVWKDVESSQSTPIASGATIHYPAEPASTSTNEESTQVLLENPSSGPTAEQSGPKVEEPGAGENTPNEETSETGEGSTGSSNLTGSEPEVVNSAEGTTSEGKTGAEGTSEGGTEETS